MWVCGDSDGRSKVADSDDAGRLFRSDPGHHSDFMPVGLSLIADF